MSSPKETTARTLPEGFAPGNDQVIIGRGKKCWEHEGNKRLRKIVKVELRDYVTAGSKVDKSLILLRVIRQIRHKNEELIGFVKQDLKTERWMELTEFAARVAVAQAFRDALSSRYKSSKQSKQYKRRVERFRLPSSPESFTVAKAVAMTPSMTSMRASTQRPINLGKLGTGFLNIPSMPLQDVLSYACDSARQGEQMMRHELMLQQRQMMHSGQMLMHQQQLSMMMMNQRPMMPMSSPSQFKISPRLITPPRSPAHNVGVMGYPAAGGRSCLSDLFDPLPLEDGADKEEDDFIDVFHSTPLPNLKAVLKSIK